MANRKDNLPLVAPSPPLPLLCPPDKKTLSKTGQILVPRHGHTFSIRHEHQQATQYDFYLPVKIYFHSATQRFLNRIGSLPQGSTLFRGAAGIWKDQFEDTYIHRFIIKPKEAGANLLASIRSELNDLAAELGEWSETIQEQYMFTETIVCINTADVLKPPKYMVKASAKTKRKKPAKKRS